MSKLSTSLKVYIGLILALSASNAIQVFLPSYQSLAPAASLPAPIPVIALVNAGIAIVIYGGLGFAGLILAKRLAFADIWSPEVNNRQRLLIPSIVGAGIGLFIIAMDLVFARFNGIGRLQHPPFPTSIFASFSAGVGEETLFRLFFISFWVWLISFVVLKGRSQGRVFWIVTSFSALVFALGHLPSLMILFNYTSVSDLPPVLIAEIILLNGVLSMFAAYYLKKYGFLAAAGIHFWADVVWHVVWGIV